MIEAQEQVLYCILCSVIIYNKMYRDIILFDNCH